MNSNFEYYKIFYYVAKYENLTKAATALKTSQPAVTRTIHKLEGELGCRLFTRSKTGMKLTPEGRTFYGYVAAGCAQFFKGENDLSNLISLENGTIYISATETALHCYLFQAMEEFNSLYPNVRFKILNNSTTESVNAVKEGKVDLAFVSANLQVAKPLRMKILRKYRDILIAGMRFEELKAGKEELSLKELVSYPWISLTAETITRRFLNEYFEKNGLTFAPDMELATTDMILPAVRHNLGLGFIPAEFADAELKSGQVFEIKVKEKLPERNIILIYDTEYPQSIAAKEFQKFLKEKGNESANYKK
ncbi:MAG: LysR family transcriptional regulator [Dorea sp.]|nr:MAG: transcriptional regulator [Clostridiales bacterium 36_14]